MRIGLGLLLIAFGCGDGSGGTTSEDEFAGIYQTTSHTRNLAGCDAEGEAVTGETGFFKLKVDNVFSSNILNRYVCTDQQTCEDADGEITFSSWIFETKTGDSWTGEATSSAGGGTGECSVTISRTSATRDAGGAVTLEKKTFNDMVATPDGKSCADAHDDLVATHGANLPCTAYEVLKGTPVE